MKSSIVYMLPAGTLVTPICVGGLREQSVDRYGVPYDVVYHLEESVTLTQLLVYEWWKRMGDDAFSRTTHFFEVPIDGYEGFTYDVNHVIEYKTTITPYP